MCMKLIYPSIQLHIHIQTIIQHTMEEKTTPQHLLTCKLCSLPFHHPITLFCGHTFCQACASTMQHTEHNKIPICPVCGTIIWKKITTFKENKTVSSLLEKYKLHREPSTIPTIPQPRETNSSMLSNRILLHCKKGKQLPMPYCLTPITFETVFIEDITQQNNIVIQWDKEFPYGLLGKLTQIESYDKSDSEKVLLYHPINTSITEQKYRAVFVGEVYVELVEMGSVAIDLSHRCMFSPEDHVKRELHICDCKPVHTEHPIPLSHFDHFFSFYDLMNNMHLMRQVATLILMEPFQHRSDSQAMMYCVLKVLKLPEELREELVKCWDDEIRIERIDEWLGTKQATQIDEIMNVKIPGKYSNGYVFFIIFVLFALHFLQQ